MILEVNLASDGATIALLEPEDCQRFHVAVKGGDPDSLAAGLAAANVGRLLASGDAMIDTAALSQLAEGRVAEGWDTEFAAMVAYARSKGWVDDSGSSLQAHIEWSA